MTRIRLWTVLIALLLAGTLFAATCGPADDEGQSPLPVPTNIPEVVNLAIADLAQRIGVDANQIEAVRVESVEWPDTSLGCPQPGQAYAQVITPGYLVVLTVEGKEYEYHTNLDQIIACEP